MNSSITLDIKANLEDLNKAISRVTKATKLDLGLDLKEADENIDKIRYQIIGIFASFKGLSAIKRPQIRRRNNAAWRKELYSAIYAKASELGLEKEDIYSIVLNKYGKKIKSLTELGEQNLTKLKAHLFAKKRNKK
ncbi:hypothetical protein BKH46_09075 [Helicobacter sp. 12S02634-8]|uniref:hypothetical protein n=1 Tax=Helicobacter sp. 12S02634-8 TaxID=1476199 RepID=UPI000BA7D49C|nr:hypothetical protein [Helicobacter sp. 12S02634-8]PAF46096.1 hypothetical protein BKH46_09075 [Helicobacter sp. 12S02634-8]